MSEQKPFREPYTEPMCMVEFGPYPDLATILEAMADYLRDPANVGTPWDVTVQESHTGKDEGKRYPAGFQWGGRLFFAFKDD